MTVAIVCVMGLPGSGKSSVCSRLVTIPRVSAALAAISNEQKVTFETISFDDIELRYRRTASEFEPTAWRQARTSILQHVRNISYTHGSEPDRLTVLLLDDNFYYKSMRKRFRPNGVIFLNRSVDECIRLNEIRSSRVPQTVIENMALLLEVPDPASCPVLTISPLPGETVDDTTEAIVRDSAFWIEVLTRSAYSTELIPIPDISFRERALNKCEVELRKCVSHFAKNRLNLGKDQIKRTSELKGAIMQRCKFLITAETSEQEAADIVESAILEFNYELDKI